MRLAKVDDFSEIIHEPLRDGLFGVDVARSASRRLRSRVWMISPKSSTSLLETVYMVLAWSGAIVDDFGEIIYLGEKTGLSDADVARNDSRRLRSSVWMISPKSSTSLLETAYSVLAWSGTIVDDFGEIIYLGEGTGLSDADVARNDSRRLRSSVWMISPKSSTSLLETVYSALAWSRTIVDDFGEIIYLGEGTGLSDADVARNDSRRLRSSVWMISPKSSTSLLETVYSALAWSRTIVDDFSEIIYLG